MTPPTPPRPPTPRADSAAPDEGPRDAAAPDGEAGGPGGRARAGRRGRGGRETRRSAWLIVECTLIFFIGPAAFAAAAPLGWLFPALWVWAVICFALLVFDRDFRTSDLLNIRGVRVVWKPVLIRFAILAAGITLAFAAADHFIFTEDDMLFSLPRHRPQLWAVIMVAYPVFSVYPQELIWRSFFYRRYDDILRRPAQLLIVSSLAFAWAHLMFPSPWVAMSMTFVGGLLFASTYQKSRSLLAAALEHALYGCLVFTIGMGRFFYSGGGA